MARYFQQNISGLGDPQLPPTEPLEGLQPMRRERWEAPMRAQDTVPTLGRRVLMSAGIGAGTTWRFINSYPSSGSEIDLGWGSFRLTPGCVLQVGILYLPSGGVGSTPSDPDNGLGRVRLQTTWTAQDASTESIDYDIDLLPSANDNFDVLSGGGAAWGELRELTRVFLPPVDLSDEAVANRWTVSPEVEIHAVHVGGSRVVDLVIFETPYQVTMESDDTDWTSHIFATGSIDGDSQAASPRPRTRRSETSPDGNPRGGSRLTMDVAREQRARMGPMLATWNVYQETNAAPTTDISPLEVTGGASGPRCVFDSTMTAYDADREGVSVSCGGYARDYLRNNGHVLGTEDAQAAIPVLFRIYADSSASVEVRFQTSEHSWVSATVTTTEGWHEGWGYLEIGINPSDVMVGQLFVDGAADLDVWAFTVQAWPHV